jgi:hypothetical protein
LGEEVRIVREAGEARRGGLRSLILSPDAPRVWDGRFEMTSEHEVVEVRALRGLVRRLPLGQQRALTAWPATARGVLPAIVQSSGDVTCPLLGSAPAQARALVEARLHAAAGLVERET